MLLKFITSLKTKIHLKKSLLSLYLTFTSTIQSCNITCGDLNLCVEIGGLEADCSGFAGCHDNCPSGSHPFVPGYLWYFSNVTTAGLLRIKYNYMALSMKFHIDIADISSSDRFPKCGSPCTRDSDCHLAQNGGKCRLIKDSCHMTCQGSNLKRLSCLSITQMIYYTITNVALVVVNVKPHYQLNL